MRSSVHISKPDTGRISAPFLSRKEAKPTFFSQIQTKLTVGQPGDKYEVEADAMADTVVQKLQPKENSKTPFFNSVNRTINVQAKCEACEAKEVQRKEQEVQEEPLQAKLKSPYILQAKCEACEAEEVQRREQESDEEPVQMKSQQAIQAKGEGEAVDTGLEQQLNGSKGGGNVMSDHTRSAMESSFGVDFGSVRIHTGSNAVQMNRDLNAQAFTHGSDVYFNQGKYQPGTTAGQHLLAHELTHVVQQNSGMIQRRLRVAPDYPEYLRSQPGNIAQQDPAFSMTSAQRFTFVNGLIQQICPDFQVNNSDGQVTRTGAATDTDTIRAGSNPAGCCCLHILTRPSATTDWRILISGTVSPHTFSAKQAALEGFTLTPDQLHNSVVIPSPNADIEYGHFTATDQRQIMEAQIVLGHELCGHAALTEMEAHPVSANRLESNEHDPTVNIQNLIATEQGVPASELRGLANGNTHRGESFARVIAQGYPINRVSVFSLLTDERAKLDFVARLVQASNFFVDVVGHTDPSGGQAINNRISLQRAQFAKSYLISKGVSRRRHINHDDPTSPLTNRFTDLRGVRSRFPPPANLSANPSNWRRVEIFMAKFPAGATNPPSGTPTIVNPVPPPQGATDLAQNGDACEQLLVRTAWQGSLP